MIIIICNTCDSLLSNCQPEDFTWDKHEEMPLDYNLLSSNIFHILHHWLRILAGMVHVSGGQIAAVLIFEPLDQITADADCFLQPPAMDSNKGRLLSTNTGWHSTIQQVTSPLVPMLHFFFYYQLRNGASHVYFNILANVCLLFGQELDEKVNATLISVRKTIASEELSIKAENSRKHLTHHFPCLQTREEKRETGGK